MKHSTTVFSTTGMMLAAIAIANPCLAQTAKAATTATAGSNDIIVTANKRSERLEEVPMTVTAVSPETLSNLGINSVRDLTNITSGFQVNNAGSYPQPSIRGVTTTNAGAYENNVALFVDGVYQYTPQVLNMDLPNVQSIQVLKGPQGTLYGRNATGGAILIDTLDPTNELKGNIEGTVANYEDHRARGYIAGPISDQIGFSVAGTIRKTDGYYKKASRTTPGAFTGDTLGLEQEAIRAKLKFDFTDNFAATLAYNYLHASDPRGVFFTPIENVSTAYTGGNATRPRGLGQVAGDVFALDLKQDETSLKLEWDTAIGKLRSVTAYTKGDLATTFDSGGSYNADNYSDSLIHDRTTQEALDFTLNTVDSLDLIVGVTYYNIDTAYGPGRANAFYTAVAPNNTPGTPISSYVLNSQSDFQRTKEALSGFIDATWRATDKLSFNIGGRYSDETQDVAAQKTNYCTAAPCTVGAVTTVPYTFVSSAQSSSYSKFTPRASVRYEIAPRTNIYASYSQGFRAGEWNSVVPLDNPALWRSRGQIGQETVDAYEIGFKTAGDKFHAELSGFYYDYKDLQVSSTAFVNGAAVVSLQAVPSAEIYGVDASADYKLTDNLNVRAGVTWLHARYGDHAVFVGTGINPNAVATSVSSDPIKNQQNATSLAMDLSGLQLARAPDISAFVGADYLIPIGEGGFLFAVNAKYTDDYVVTNPSIYGGEAANAYAARLLTNPNALPNNNAQLAGTPFAARSSEQRGIQEAFTLINASVTYTDPSDSYYLRVWGNNLTDEQYKVHYSPSGGGTYTPIGEPLTFGATAGYKF